VVKIASRCNLNCSYCYMYNKGDNSYLKQPKIMSAKTVDALLNRIYLHCEKYDIKKFIVCFHGGEPMLVGKDFFIKFDEKAKSIFGGSGIELTLSMQTNAVLIDREWAHFFKKLNIYVSVSLDGDKQTHDQYRLDHKGRGSYDRTIAGIKYLMAAHESKRSVNTLAVININSDPIAQYWHFVNVGIKYFDFLLPDSNYDQLEVDFHKESTQYADWLIKVFDVWFNHKGAERPRIRIFLDLINGVLGQESSTDALGNLDNGLLVIETDGGIEAVDVLKICGEGFTKNSKNVATHNFDEVIDEGLIDLYYFSHTKLCGQCQACEVKDICGGGYLPHRYSSKNGFNNPSIYCKSLIKLIAHIQNAVLETIPQEIVSENNLAYLQVDNVYTSAFSGDDSEYATFLESYRKSSLLITN
jgi:uncharacterized protein